VRRALHDAADADIALQHRLLRIADVELEEAPGAPARGVERLIVEREGQPTVRGVDRQRAWCEGFSLHVDVGIANHDREALKCLCSYGAALAFAFERLA
jgi:hypothetical protein